MPGLKAARPSDKRKEGRSFRETVQFYMIDFKTPLGRAIDIVIIALNLIAVSIFVLHTYDLSSAQQEMLWKLEIAVVGVFIMEYALRLYGAPDRGKHLKDAYSMIDLAAILPTLILLALPASFFVYDIRFIQILRVLAVFRIFRFLRFVSKSHMLFETISQGKINIAQLVFSVVIFFFVYSGIFYFVESPLNPKVNNFGDAFYFIVVAVSTVGFGDIVPVTGVGKLVTVVMIISGIILIPFQAARIFRAWMASDRERKVQICPGCGLDRHDADAIYCKACGEALPGDR